MVQIKYPKAPEDLQLTEASILSYPPNPLIDTVTPQNSHSFVLQILLYLKRKSPRYSMSLSSNTPNQFHALRVSLSSEVMKFGVVPKTVLDVLFIRVSVGPLRPDPNVRPRFLAVNPLRVPGLPPGTRGGQMAYPTSLFFSPLAVFPLLSRLLVSSFCFRPTSNLRRTNGGFPSPMLDTSV